MGTQTQSALGVLASRAPFAHLLLVSKWAQLVMLSNRGALWYIWPIWGGSNPLWAITVTDRFHFFM